MSHLKFFVQDLYTGQVWFGTQGEIAAWWKQHNGKNNFSQLNMTGNDTYRMEMPVYTDDRNILWIPQYPKRRYKVYDEEGRSIDIRLWPKELWRPRPIVQRSPYYGQSGKKRHRRRGHAPAGVHRILKSACSQGYHQYIDEDELLAPPIRNKAIPSWTDIEDHYEKRWRRMDNSWKKRSKCHKQWQRHMDTHGRFGGFLQKGLCEDWYEDDESQSEN